MAFDSYELPDSGSPSINEYGIYEVSEVEACYNEPGILPTAETADSEIQEAVAVGFGQLYPFTPHMVARTAVNDKLAEMAATELGIDRVQRFPVPDELIDWDTGYPGYDPPLIDVPRGDSPYRKPDDYVDPRNPRDIPTFKSSEQAEIRRDHLGRPLNPCGRTGLQGRGMLNEYGPTPATDAIVTRHNAETGMLEALLVQRIDTGEWALPGGKVNRGESVHETVGRELQEEAGVQGITLDFNLSRIVYVGYVDDSRNTDNSWMETTAFHYHLSATEAAAISVMAGSDAAAARWAPITEALYGSLFGSHGRYLRLAVEGRPEGDLPSSNEHPGS